MDRASEREYDRKYYQRNKEIKDNQRHTRYYYHEEDILHDCEEEGCFDCDCDITRMFGEYCDSCKGIQYAR